MNSTEIEKIRSAYRSMNDYVPLTEASLAHILKKEKYDEGFAIVSACRADWDTESEQNNSHINRMMSKNLARDIKECGFGFIPVFGGFIENKGTPNEVHTFEKSYMVFPYSNRGEKLDFKGLADFAFSVGIKYRQDSVLIKEPTVNGDVKAPYYLTTTASEDYAVGDRQEYFGKDAYKINDITQQYFTSLRKRARKYDDETDNPRRFTLTECYVQGDPKTHNGAVSRHLSGEIVNY